MWLLVLRFRAVVERKSSTTRLVLLGILPAHKESEKTVFILPGTLLGLPQVAAVVAVLAMVQLPCVAEMEANAMIQRQTLLLQITSLSQTTHLEMVQVAELLSLWDHPLPLVF
jgi:hypothetical protein